MAIMALHSAATGLQALSTQLDVISNNIANANNDGFKGSRVNFEDLVYQHLQDAGSKDEQNDTRPTGIQVGLGTRVSGTQLDMTQGSPTVTGRDLDVCINGDGFFQVKTLPTQGDGLAYTRSGQFFVNDQGDMVLNSTTGYKLDPAINIPKNATGITISSDGARVCDGAGKYGVHAGRANPTCSLCQSAGAVADWWQFVSADGCEWAAVAEQSGDRRDGHASAGFT